MILNQDEKGFTLLEILLSLVILTILVLAVSNTFITGFDVWNYNADKINMQQINRIIGMRIAPDIRAASEIFAPNLPEELRISFGVTRDD
ncbi:MAG TPA: prepilin-type N-terminal cleavage/methylation domain-containing protein, partial [Halanaerobiales bacterium]|nr:prepilin-type N-terminal cleavage/methylation domain-containing protein [Halanaerobiales bacterium]